MSFVLYHFFFYFYSLCSLHLNSDPHTSLPEYYIGLQWRSLSLYSASVAVLVSGILLLGYPGCGVIFPCTGTSSGQLRNPQVLAWVIVYLHMTSSPQTACFQLSVLLLDLTSRFQVYKYYISLTLTKLSNLYRFNSLLTGILLYFQSGPITVAK